MAAPPARARVAAAHWPATVDGPVVRLSVIIPTLNVADAITELLNGLAPLRAAGHEIVLADGGSHDATVENASPRVDRVVVSPPGRAVQMNAGARVATGHWRRRCSCRRRRRDRPPDGRPCWRTRSHRPGNRHPRRRSSRPRRRRRPRRGRPRPSRRRPPSGGGARPWRGERARAGAGSGSSLAPGRFRLGVEAETARVGEAFAEVD